MEPSALIFSSHDRCNYIHNDWLVQRALRGNKQIVYLPMSEGLTANGDVFHRQQYGWSKFQWFFNFYNEYGLKAFPFFWNDHLSDEDVDTLFQSILTSEVVILGGGDPSLGLTRYKGLGKDFYGDPDAFAKALHHRQSSGLLTAGFSAGVDQLCQYVHSYFFDEIPDRLGFGICRNIVASSHFDDGRGDFLMKLAKHYGSCLAFGLPNDSGIAYSQGETPGGNVWQLLTMIIDNSWDHKSDQHHIKSRHGVKIQHFYPDGRHWAFNGGDMLLRVQSWDERNNEAYIIRNDGSILDYWSQIPVHNQSIEEIVYHR